MATMYEKLGELLSESLEKGEVLQFTEEDTFSEEKFDIFQNLSSSQEKSEKKSAEKIKEESKEQNKEHKQFTAGTSQNRRKSSINQKRKKTGMVYKVLPPEVERAYRLLDITVSATQEDIKKAYKEKLKYYHPDRHQNNEVLQKVATNKTKQIVEAFNLLMNYKK